MNITADLLQRITEAALMAASKPLSIQALQQLFEDEERPSKTQLDTALAAIAEKSQDRGFELQEVASGWRFQVCQELSPWVARLWEERPQKYSRALLETLALVSYRQPITRGDIENIRGVAVSSHIMRTLLDRGWVRIVGHRDVPGRPAMYATTREFLDYFNLQSLDQLPTLAEIRDLDNLNQELNLDGENEGDKAQAAAAHKNALLQVDVVEEEAVDIDAPKPMSAADIAAAVENEPEPEEEAASFTDILNEVSSMDVDDEEDFSAANEPVVTQANVEEVQKFEEPEDKKNDFNNDALVHFSDDIDPAFLDDED